MIHEWKLPYRKDIVKTITNNIVSLSMHKFSSNVVEKCIELDDIEIRRTLCKELFKSDKISSLLKNKFGNFVIQKALKILPENEKQIIKEELTKHVNIVSVKERARLSKLIEII